MAVEIAEDLMAFLDEESARSRMETLQLRAETALKSYNGDYYGDEVDGNSKVVSRDVAETIDYMSVAVLRTFVAGDRVVEFEPDSPQSEQFADDATETITRQFAHKGYQLLHDWLKEGNINTLGIVKAVAERKRERVTVVTHDPEGIGAIGADYIGTHPESGVDLYNAAILKDGKTEFRDYLVPLEEFRISPEARDPDDAVYIAHAAPVTISDLVQLGFDPDDVEDIQGDDADVQSSPLGFARDEGVNVLTVGDRIGPNRRVILMEEYVRFDADRDGIAERLCIWRVGTTILKIEPVDYQPFVIYCPFPMPGRIIGDSLADKVTDIQRVNTALMRLALDGLYRNLAPRTYVPDECVNASTIDDLLTVIPGGLVRYKGVNKPEPEPKNDVSATAFQAIEFMIGQRESRTGITRMNQGLDADALNKTATGTALMQAQGRQMEEYLARNFAEAVAKLMRLKLLLMVRYGGPMQLRVDGQYRQIDPSQWPEEMNVVIRVGLGTGHKDQRIQNRMTFLQVMREVMLGGVPIVQPEQLYKMMAGLVKDMSLGSPNDYVIDPSTLPPQPQQQQPDPEMTKVQGMLELNAQKLQMEGQKQAGQLQLKQAEIAAKASQQHLNDQAQAAIAIRGQNMNQELGMAKIDLAAHQAHQESLRKQAESDARVKQMRTGGALDK
jgi:hypothetical protein